MGASLYLASSSFGRALDFVRLRRSRQFYQYQFWGVLLVAASYVATGIWFIRGRRWARRTMAVLVTVAALLFLDMLLMSGWVGNRSGVWEMLVALAIAGYTLLFLVISAAWHSAALR